MPEKITHVVRNSTPMSPAELDRRIHELELQLARWRADLRRIGKLPGGHGQDAGGFSTEATEKPRRGTRAK